MTAVCSGANAQLVSSLGADSVIDYTEEDPTTDGHRYDVIFDAVGTSSFLRCYRSLNDGGVFLTTVPSLAILVQMLWTSKIGRRRARIEFTGLRKPVAKAKDLIALTALAEDGTLIPVIDRSYPLARAAEAHRYVDTKRKRGSVVLSVVDPA